ncbi:MAG TPA: right-handed parallel beta-helix repeat-containing protein, partial [Longimicrobium sp.]|nr:right-handed parallel beta-helix repeat-containing protein [Longimicrobium sp.]
VYLDSAVIRRAGMGVTLSSGSRLARSLVDSTTNRGGAAVTLFGGARFEQTVVRGSAGVGVRVAGNGVLLLGGRIEGSRGTGLAFSYDAPPASFRPVRIVGGQGYPVEIYPAALARTYATPALQDSLLGNARDSLLVSYGSLRRPLTVGPRMPVRFISGMHVDSGATFTAQPGARLVFNPFAGLNFVNGGRLSARGSKAAPVVFTAEYPEVGWAGIALLDSAAAPSYLTNVRIEHVGINSEAAVAAYDAHRVFIDSTVFRQVSRAVDIWSANSRLMRTRVDTTLNGDGPAVRLRANARIESTLVRAPAGAGIAIASPSVVVASCEVRDGDGPGILLLTVARVQNCNLENNAGPGIQNDSGAQATATNNWWGSTGGPGGSGGDGASGPLNFTPWRTAPFVLPYVP